MPVTRQIFERIQSREARTTRKLKLSDHNSKRAIDERLNRPEGGMVEGFGEDDGARQGAAAKASPSNAPKQADSGFRTAQPLLDGAAASRCPSPITLPSRPYDVVNAQDLLRFQEP